MEPDQRTFRKGDVIFQEGDTGENMFEILCGKVGIYAGETLLTELGPGATFGEMGMVEARPRSATALALSDATSLRAISWDTLGAYFRDRPAKVVVMMQQMSRRIRELTEDYLGACKGITEMAERAEHEKRREETAWVNTNLRRYLDAYQAYRQ